MVAAGDPIFASDINDWRPITAVKNLAGAKNTLIVASADPDLFLNLLTSATYDVLLKLFISSNANLAGDFRWNLGWSGTASVSYSGLSVVGGIASGGSADVIASPGTRLDNASPGLDYVSGASTAGVTLFGHARVVTSTPVTLTLAWAQRVSNANDTKLLEGSSMTAQRVL